MNLAAVGARQGALVSDPGERSRPSTWRSAEAPHVLRSLVMGVMLALYSFSLGTCGRGGTFHMLRDSRTAIPSVLRRALGRYHAAPCVGPGLGLRSGRRAQPLHMIWIKAQQPPNTATCQFGALARPRRRHCHRMPSKARRGLLSEPWQVPFACALRCEPRANEVYRAALSPCVAWSWWRPARSAPVVVCGASVVVARRRRAPPFRQ